MGRVGWKKYIVTRLEWFGCAVNLNYRSSLNQQHPLVLSLNISRQWHVRGTANPLYDKIFVLKQRIKALTSHWRCNVVKQISDIHESLKGFLWVPDRKPSPAIPMNAPRLAKCWNVPRFFMEYFSFLSKSIMIDLLHLGYWEIEFELSNPKTNNRKRTNFQLFGTTWSSFVYKILILRMIFCDKCSHPLWH